MTNYFKFLAAALFLWLLQACSVNTETTYYKDAATSMQSNILMDKSMFDMMNRAGQSPSGNVGASPFGKLTTEWKSLYDLQKDGMVKLNEDSVKVLKKLYMKLNKDKNDVLGVSVKYDKLLPAEVTQLFSQSRQLRNIPLQDAARWDGKTLTIDTGKFNLGSFLEGVEKMSGPSPDTAPKTKSDSIAAYGKQMAKGMVGMLRMFNMDITSTMKFQKPIKSITGRHDYVKQIDNNTVKITVHSKEMLDEHKKLKDKDSKIVIVTE